MRHRLALLLLAVPILALGACGGGGGGNKGADPATAVPAGAPIYLELVARPGGDLRAGAEAALRKVLRTDDAARRTRELFDRAAAPKLRWQDVSPWLGERVGLFLTSLDGRRPNGAVVAAMTDAGKARAALDKLAGSGSGERSYKGVTYRASGSDKASGVVGDFAVVGSERGLRAVVDAVKGAPALAGSADYRRARGAVPSGGALGFAYVDTSGLIDAVAGSAELGSAGPALRAAVGQIGDTLAAALQADAKAIRVAGAALGTKPPGSAASGTSGADVAAALPGDAWLALGLGDLGGSLRTGLGQIRSLGSLGGVDVAAALDGFRRRSGLDVERDLLSWMGSGALYARGTGLADVGAVLTIRTTDAAKSDRGVTRLARVLARAGVRARPTDVAGYDRAFALRLPGLSLPIPFYLASSPERVSFGVNPDALTAVAKPAGTLGASPRYRAAAAILGGGLRPAFLLDLPTVLNLVEGLGAGGASGYTKIKPYLDAFGVLAAGSRRDGDVTKATLAVALR